MNSRIKLKLLLKKKRLLEERKELLMDNKSNKIKDDNDKERGNYNEKIR